MEILGQPVRRTRDVSEDFVIVSSSKFEVSSYLMCGTYSNELRSSGKWLVHLVHFYKSIHIKNASG